MKKFLSRVLAFLVVLALGPALLFCFTSFVVGDQYSDSYMGAIHDKINRMQMLPSPKIILLGNSNLAFGINSKMIEEELGMPVVNLGLAGGMGNAFCENVVKLGLQAGDIVVECPSKFSDEDVISDPVLYWSVLENNWYLYQLPRIKDIKTLVSAYPKYAFYAIKRWLGYSEGTAQSAYLRSAMNEYGDIYLRPEGITYEFTQPVKAGKADAAFVERVNEFNEYVLSKGAKLVLAGYPIGQGEWTDPVENFDAFQEKLKSELDCPVISDYKDYLIPYEYFFDTNLHLTEEGAAMRTNQLIEDLKNWMQEE